MLTGQSNRPFLTCHGHNRAAWCRVMATTVYPCGMVGTQQTVLAYAWGGTNIKPGSANALGFSKYVIKQARGFAPVNDPLAVFLAKGGAAWALWPDWNAGRLPRVLAVSGQNARLRHTLRWARCAQGGGYKSRVLRGRLAGAWPLPAFLKDKKRQRTGARQARPCRDIIAST